MHLYQGARATKGSDAAETMLSALICRAALNELTLAALVAGIMSSLFRMSTPSNERSLVLVQPSIKALPLKQALDQSSLNYQIIVSREDWCGLSPVSDVVCDQLLPC